MFGSTPSKADMKLIRSLALKKNREAEGLFVVEGEKMVAEALSSGMEVLCSYRTADIGEEAMSRMTLLSSPSPALAVVRKSPARTAEEIFSPGISLALDSVRDPGNIGTILRMADWFGIANVFASEDSVDLYNPKAIQASMGSVFRKQICYTDLQKVIRIYRKTSVPVYATALEGEVIYDAPLDRRNALILMGSENNGVSPELLAECDRRLFIPPYPADALGHTSESLNVAVATSILCYEFRRR